MLAVPLPFKRFLAALTYAAPLWRTCVADAGWLYADYCMGQATVQHCRVSHDAWRVDITLALPLQSIFMTQRRDWRVAYRFVLLPAVSAYFPAIWYGFSLDNIFLVPS